MLPNRAMLHVNRPLTDISINYKQDNSDFFADKVFARVKVKKQSDIYTVYDKSYWQKAGAEVRADATESAGGGFTVDVSKTYFCKPYAWHTDVGYQSRLNADNPLDLDRDAALFVMNNLLLRREKSFIDSFFKTGVWTGAGGDFTPAIKWSATNSLPIQDIDGLKTTVKSKTGKMPNRLVIGRDVFNALKNNASILERIKYTQTANIQTEQLLSALFGLEVVVADTVLDTAQEGQPGNPNFAVNNQFLLAYANPTPSIMQPSAGYIFEWTDFAPGLGDLTISQFPRPELKADRIEGEMAYDMKIIGNDLGVLGTAVLV